MSTPAQLSPVQSTLGRGWARGRLPAVRYLSGVLVLAAAYYASAKVGQTLRYTASVSAIWPPAGLGIAALYLWGVRWWPGVFIAELVVNAELLAAPHPLPLGSLLGQQAGNMAEVVVGALLLRAADRPAARRSIAPSRSVACSGAGGRDRDQRDRGDGVDAGRRGHHRG